MTNPKPKRRWDAGVEAALRPPPKRTLSEWADAHFRLSAESAAEPGRWKTLSYQRGILDAITDPAVGRVSVMKSARIGYTKGIDAAVGYFIHQDPCPILVVQPTVEDAEGYSKEEIAPMLRDCEVLAGLVKDAGPKSAQTILHKRFPGGVLSIVGANSGRGFRRVSRRVVIFDEVDGYPASAGNEGDPIKLGERRAEYYWNRKIVAGSTPLIAGASRIEELFNAGDRRRYYVPCPHCGHMDHLRFRGEMGIGQGHVMHFPDGPDSAHFVCGGGCKKPIEEPHKRAMIDEGEWRAEAEFKGHASFRLWTAYSLSPNATWAQIVEEFLDAKDDPLKLKTFVNTVLGEVWVERGDAPDWERLYNRRESYKIGTVPDGVILITAGVDVQKDRFVAEVVGWGANKESYSIEHREIFGDTALDSTWQKLDDELLSRAYIGTDGAAYSIAMLAVDSGYNTQMVYNWARRHPLSRVIATKGQAGTSRMLIGTASKVDITVRGKKLARGYRMFPVGVDTAKSELYGFLGLSLNEDGTAPPGYCHFPEHDKEFFRQITAEHLVTSTNKKSRRPKLEWHVQPGRQNHVLDARILARAAAALLGIDRLDAEQRARTKAIAKAALAPSSGAAAAAAVEAPPQPPPAPAQQKGFWGKGRSRSGGWFGRRR